MRLATEPVSAKGCGALVEPAGGDACWSALRVGSTAENTTASTAATPAATAPAHRRIRRRRRRADDPTETAPQAIIDRVLSDSGKLRPITDEQPPPHRRSRSRSGKDAPQPAQPAQPAGENPAQPEPPAGQGPAAPERPSAPPPASEQGPTSYWTQRFAAGGRSETPEVPPETAAEATVQQPPVAVPQSPPPAAAEPRPVEGVTEQLPKVTEQPVDEAGTEVLDLPTTTAAEQEEQLAARGVPSSNGLLVPTETGGEFAAGA